MCASNRSLIVVIGPTAVGKTSFCVALAKHYATEIISADSRQFFKEMAIGTAKPTSIEMDGVKHHLVDHLSIQQSYTIADFESDALNLVEKLFNSHSKVIVTGGSGLYVKALCEGLDDIPEVDNSIRDTLNKAYREKGIGHLKEQLKLYDPDYYAQVDEANPQRLIRALEVYIGTGKPFSSFRQNKKKERPFHMIKIGLELPRELLYERINDRIDLMVEQGLFEEANSLYDFRDLNALQTVGYKEVFGYLDGDYDREEAIRLLKRNSRRYAKRQLTWFKRDNTTHWVSPTDFQKVIQLIDKETIV